MNNEQTAHAILQEAIQHTTLNKLIDAYNSIPTAGIEWYYSLSVQDRFEMDCWFDSAGYTAPPLCLALWLAAQLGGLIQ